MSERIVVAGGTGVVGRRIVDKLVADGGALVVSVQRREASATRHGVRVIVDDGSDVDRLAQRLGRQPPPLAFICALGTTRKAAGSDAAFVAVDRDLVVRMASAAHAVGTRRAVVVSSVGADPASKNLYLRTKGEMERAVADIGFERVDFLRPGLLRAARDEFRPGEALARGVAPLVDPLLLGALKRYRSIDADTVAEAAVVLATTARSAVVVHEFDDLSEVVRRG